MEKKRHVRLALQLLIMLSSGRHTRTADGSESAVAASLREQRGGLASGLEEAFRSSGEWALLWWAIMQFSARHGRTGTGKVSADAEPLGEQVNGVSDVGGEQKAARLAAVQRALGLSCSPAGSSHAPLMARRARLECLCESSAVGQRRRGGRVLRRGAALRSALMLFSARRGRTSTGLGSENVVTAPSKCRRTTRRAVPPAADADRPRPRPPPPDRRVTAVVRPSRFGQLCRPLAGVLNAHYVDPL